jgi:hypothetical protein
VSIQSFRIIKNIIADHLEVFLRVGRVGNADLNDGLVLCVSSDRRTPRNYTAFSQLHQIKSSIDGSDKVTPCPTHLPNSDLEAQLEGVAYYALSYWGGGGGSFFVNAPLCLLFTVFNTSTLFIFSYQNGCRYCGIASQAIPITMSLQNNALHGNIL